MTTYSDAPTIDVALDKERVKQMGMEEKINVLIDIGFANHSEIHRQGLILYGEHGDKGLCESVRLNKAGLFWLWGIFCGVAATFFGILIFHIGKA